MKIKQGFTLAEVLITLTIIGVVASMTIPSLIMNIDLDRKQAEAEVKKVYTAVNDATKQIVMMETTSHSMAKVNCASHDCIRDLYAKYMQFVKTCSSSSQTACLDGASATSNDTTSFYSTAAYAADPKPTGVDFTSKSLAVLADGTLMGFKYDNTCSLSTKTVIAYEEEPIDVTGACVEIAIDVNGAKKPNKTALDRYQFPVGKLGVKMVPKNASATTP